MSDALTLHYSESSHTLKLWGTGSHSNDLGEIWERGIYSFKIVAYYFNLKKLCYVRKGQSYLSSIPLDNPKETFISPVLI